MEEMNFESQTTQLFIYLSKVTWQQLPKAAAEFMSPEARISHHNATTLEIVASWGTLRAERFVLHPELMPWEAEVSLTLYQAEGPLTPWLNLQFAQDIASSLGCETWCDPPQFHGFPSSRWKIRINQTGAELKAHLVDLLEHDLHWVEIKKVQPLELRNLELFQTRLPYRKARV